MSTVLEMRHICKEFPGVLANDDICLNVERGEVHALLGENGAGKSTLMNVLCGLYRPTSGEIYLEGKPIRFSSAKDAIAAGIGMVHQHFMLIPTLSVVENCMIGIRDRSSIRLDTESAAKDILKMVSEYGMEIDPYRKVSTLSVGEMQRVEIIKALYRGANLLILDEPTAVLTPQETRRLFHMVQNLIAKGLTVLFISHKLHEVKTISNRVTVLRRGKALGTYDTAACTVAELAKLMVGRDVDFTVQRADRTSSECALSVTQLSYVRKDKTKCLHDVTFDVNEGEVLGIAGVDGNGQSELVECITGLLNASGGEAVFRGTNLLRSTPRKIAEMGVSFIPQDRQKTGLVMQMPLTENFILHDYHTAAFGKKGFIDKRRVSRYGAELIGRYDVKTPGPNEWVQNLSGGNQQKVVVARELSRPHRLLIAMHPTRGLDVGAIEYIHTKIMEERDEGVAILLVSTEIEEILKLSDRIVVLYEGRIMGIVTPDSTTVEELGLMMGGMSLDAIRRPMG